MKTLITFILLIVFAQNAWAIAAHRTQAVDFAKANGKSAYIHKEIVKTFKDLESKSKDKEFNKKHFTKKKLKEIYKEEMDILLDFYTDYYSAEEIRQLTRMYKTTAGKKLRDSLIEFDKWYKDEKDGASRPLAVFVKDTEEKINKK